ncbi:MAG: hypothetical protein Q9211_006481 [Gyalolechia sp. 1 TL-2023]
MKSIDFAAAQKRVADRRKARNESLRARDRSRSSDYALRASDRLPYPLRNWTRTGIEAWDTIKGREGTRPAFRVGQVDAELLDEELLELLKGQVGEALKYFGSHLRDEWSSEILFALRVVLFKLSIWDHDASYGAALQNLRYTDARHIGSLPKAPSRWQKASHGFFSIGGRYVWESWSTWLADQEGSYDGVSCASHSMDTTNLVKPSPRVRVLSQVSSLASTTHSVAAFSSFLLFLINGRYRTLLDRILRLRLTPRSNHVSRQVSFEYLNRQLVWHAFTEFLLFLLPLVGIARWRRWLSRTWRKTKALVRQGDEEGDMGDNGELAFLPERTCAICYQNQNLTSASENDILTASGASGGVVGSAQTDITNPYEMLPCGCTYCFVCAASRLEAADGDGWICLRCGALVKECKPWAGDVIESSYAQNNKKSVSFQEDETESVAKG